jgi:hypothetical protein
MLFGLFDSDSSGIIRPEVFAKLVATGQVSISPTFYEHFFRTVVTVISSFSLLVFKV